MYTIAVLLLAINVYGLRASEYTVTAECENTEVCIYNYSSDTTFERGNQMKISLQVDFMCESEGMYEDIGMIRNCIKTSNVHIDIPGIINGNSEEELKRIARLNKHFDKEFCFLRGKNGKIPKVYHPSNEEKYIINIKKSIASAYQANLKHTAVEDETDAQSHHLSHYNYAEGENGHTKQHRVVDSSDVKEYAGDTTTDFVKYHMEEDVELDKSNHILCSSGVVSVHELGDKANSYWDDEEEIDGLDENARVPSTDGKSNYTLKLIRCSHDSGRVRRTAYLSRHLKTRAVTDTLLAKRDKAAEDKKIIKELYKSLPSLDVTITRMRRDTDSKVLGKTIKDWRRLLKLESQYGYTAAKTTVIDKLNQRVNNPHPDEEQSRLTLYGLLSSEGSLESQKALIQALESPIGKDEYSAILLYISFLSSVDSSTELYLRNMILSQKYSNSSGLLLAYGTLGRFDNIEDDVIQTLVALLTDPASSVDKVVLLIHALGNSGSDKIVPIVVPFIFCPDTVVQLAAIDALRAVSRNEIVLKAFASYVEEVKYEEQVIGVVRSLLFPFKKSVYFQQSPRGAGTSEVEQHLMDVLIDSSVRFQSVDLNKALRAYFKYVDTKKSQSLDTVLQEVNTNATRSRRATTTNWNRGKKIYNAIASRSSRTQDERDFKYDRAFMWAEQLGTDDLHVTVAAGAFGGVGTGGYKMFARGALEIHAWNSDIIVAEVEYINQLRSPQKKSYAMLAGTVFINEEVNEVDIPYLYEYSKTLVNIQVFGFEFHFWLYVATLDVYISADINAVASFEMKIDVTQASASFSLYPTFTISGEASSTVLAFWKVGFDLSASLGYSIKPMAKIGFCTEKGDSSACLGVYSGPTGSIDIAAFYREWSCSIGWWEISCDWSKKYKVDSLSYSWDLFGSKAVSLLWGKCGVCNCPNSLGVFCDAQNGALPGIGKCSCTVENL